MMFDAVTTMTQLAKAGKVRALGTTGTSRSALTPDLPTIAETVPGYEATILDRRDGSQGHAQRRDQLPQHGDQ